jgi:hypothetical protein
LKDHPGGPGTAARLANVPGCQKLAPLSSAHDERWARKAEKAIAEIKASNRGENFRETTATSHRRPRITVYEIAYLYPLMFNGPEHTI